MRGRSGSGTGRRKPWWRRCEWWRRYVTIVGLLDEPLAVDESAIVEYVATEQRRDEPSEYGRQSPVRRKPKSTNRDSAKCRQSAKYGVSPQRGCWHASKYRHTARWRNHSRCGQSA